MTGFGDARGQNDRCASPSKCDRSTIATSRSSIKSPERYQPLEGEIEHVVRESISRGTVNVVLRIDGVGGGIAYRLDATVLKSYWQQLTDLATPWNSSRRRIWAACSICPASSSRAIRPPAIRGRPGP